MGPDNDITVFVVNHSEKAKELVVKFLLSRGHAWLSGINVYKDTGSCACVLLRNGRFSLSNAWPSHRTVNIIYVRDILRRRGYI